MVTATMPVAGTLITTLDAYEARQLTTEINHHAELLREKLLRFYQGKGWLALGYDSFQAWADAECVFSWQHVYKLVGVAQVEENLTLIEGEAIVVPVNHGKHLAKLDTPLLQQQAYRLAQQIARTVACDVLTEVHVQKAVQNVQRGEFAKNSPHRVVAQMVADDDLTPKEGEKIAKWLDQSPPETQVYAQEKLVEGLTNMNILHKIINRHAKQVKSGKPSSALKELDATGCIDGKPLDQAEFSDWKRMNAELSAEYQSDAITRKQQQNLDDPIVEPKAMNAYTNSPEKTLESLKRVLDDKTLDGLFELMAKERGYVRGGVPAALVGESGTGSMDIWMRKVGV